MTIYEKLNKAKLAIQAANIKKSGKNAFAGYEYFELGDFLPTIIALESELKFCCVVSFDKESATLRVINAEAPDENINFTSPMSSANLKGMHDVQNLGAVQTYIRRYLYVNAFEIVEHDAVDKSEKQEPTKPTEQAPTKQDKSTKITNEQFKVLADACMSWGPDQADKEKKRLQAIYTKRGYKSARDIEQSDYQAIHDEFIKHGLPFDV